MDHLLLLSIASTWAVGVIATENHWHNRQGQPPLEEIDLISPSGRLFLLNYRMKQYENNIFSWIFPSRNIMSHESLEFSLDDDILCYYLLHFDI